MDLKRYSEHVFLSDPDVVSVCVVDERYEMLGLFVREGLGIYASEEYIRQYISITAPLVVEAFKKRERDLGTLGVVVVRYEKFVLSISPVQDKIVILGFRPSVVFPFAERLSRIINEPSSTLISDDSTVANLSK